MDGLKKVLAVFALLAVVLAFTVPAMAQSYGGQMGQQQPAYQGGTQQGQMGQGQAGQGQQGGLTSTNKDLAQTLQDTQQVSLFAAAVKAAGYDQILSQQEGPFMVFAPSDQALQSAGYSDMSAMDPSMAKSLVESCIVSKVSEPAQGSDTISMTSIGGQTINAKKSQNSITVNGIKVSNVMKAENGMLIITDGIVGMK